MVNHLHKGDLPKGLSFGAAVAVDSKDQVYVFNRGAHPMCVFDRSGKFLRSWGEGQYPRAHGLHIDAHDTLYLTDDGGHFVRKCTTEGRVLLEIGVPGRPAPFMSGEPFHRCTHTALSPKGEIYVSDGYGNACVHKYSPDGKLLAYELSEGDEVGTRRRVGWASSAAPGEIGWVGGSAHAFRPDSGATEAHAKAVAGEVVLVDVRTPDEWRETGLPASGHAITMHQEARGLLAGLDKAMGGDRSKPLAIICRTGNRTTMLQAELKKVGYTNVINVAEGMAGGPNGTGWVKSGLPTRPGTGASIAMPQTKAPCAAC